MNATLRKRDGWLRWPSRESGMVPIGVRRPSTINVIEQLEELDQLDHDGWCAIRLRDGHHLDDTRAGLDRPGRAA